MPASSPPPADRELPDLFARNRAWAEATVRERARLLREAHAAADARATSGSAARTAACPANEIVGLAPGEMFVHRNVANVVVHTDLNCLSVLQYAVDVLEVEHVIVCGHYGCGGVRAAWNARPLGLIDNWLRHVQDVAARHTTSSRRSDDGTALTDRLCELNVVEQAVHVCRTTIMQDAWRRGRTVTVHAWVYSLEDGLLRDLAFTASNAGGGRPQLRARAQASPHAGRQLMLSQGAVLMTCAGAGSRDARVLAAPGHGDPVRRHHRHRAAAPRQGGRHPDEHPDLPRHRDLRGAGCVARARRPIPRGCWRRW